ncbi:hypothetical protein MMC10_010783 [Thelotrema lepadinum]|nr:hypothetical protein [Thelotrema lepadinum]
MAPKPGQYLNGEWVDRCIISQIPSSVIQQSPLLASSIAKWQERKEGLIPLAASSLKPHDIYAIFDLEEQVIDFAPKEQDLLALPDGIEQVFAGLSSIIDSKAAPNEALSRLYINTVVLSCVSEEVKVAEKAQSGLAAFQPDSGSSSEPPLTPAHKSAAEAQPIHLYLETRLEKEVVYKGKPHMLSGFVDYSLGYEGVDKSSGNLLVVEAKRRYEIGAAYGQLLAYMAIIHEARLKEQKDNTVVYGVATDGYVYCFWRISNDSKKELTAGMFSGVEGDKLDYGVLSLWDKIFTTEDDPDAELIEMD